MKIAVIYYSFSGNTHNAVLFLRQNLEKREHQVCLLRLKPYNEESSFFKQCREAFLKKEPELKGAEYDLKEYGFVVFAAPVWAFTIAPALRSYLKKAGGLKNKKAGFILTYGSGAGVNKTKKELKQILNNKGAAVVFGLSLKGSRVRDKKYLEQEFSSLTVNFQL